MVVCRPRKEWPAYFTLSINELPGQEEGNERQVNLPPSFTSLITQKFLMNDDDDDNKSCGSIGSDEAVLFVNPCNYTLEVDDYEIGGGEFSAFDPEIIEEENGLNDEKVNRQELKRQLESGDKELDEAHIKAELTIAFRDKKQIKKLNKEKTI